MSNQELPKSGEVKASAKKTKEHKKEQKYFVPRPESVKQEMILNHDAQILVIGGAAGSGKSYLLQLIALRYIDDPFSSIIMFRRKTPQLRGAGGLFSKAKMIYSALPPKFKPKIKESTMDVLWPSGAVQKYNHMEHEGNILDHQGLEYTLIGFDEGTQFEWEQIAYLMSRMRSQSKYKSRMVISCNPDPDHKLRELIEWYLDEDGYPIPERDGVTRYLVRRDGDIFFADTEEELAEKFDIPEDEYEEEIMSFSFISATIWDNPVMLKENRSYLASLKALEPVEKARLLDGNWYARPAGDNYFKREELVWEDKIPSNLVLCRAWDKAAKEPTTENKTPDYTASIKMGKDPDGYYYIMGDFESSNKDPDTEVLGRFRKRMGDRDKTMIKQAQYDGEECVIVLPIDPAQAGKFEFQESRKRFVSAGFRCQPDPVPNNKNKLAKFMPFADAVEAGLVKIVPSTFPNEETLKTYLAELEKFNGEKSTKIRKDDWVDATATAFNYLTQERSLKVVPRRQQISRTQLYTASQLKG